MERKISNLFEYLPKKQILKVSELVETLKCSFEDAFSDIWVEGEVSNLRRPSSGHLYFSLKDEKTSIRVVMFRSSVNALRFRIENGLLITVRGKVTIYPPSGDMQISVVFAEPSGIGALLLAFEQLKKKLSDEGLFNESGKRSIPQFPKRIGVVTSPSGAVVRDIIRILKKRGVDCDIVISPSRVQGEGAYLEVIDAIHNLIKVGNIDVIILARGGGSIEDLWAFNEEALARAIAACPLPVISAIGHETDFTISDMVADLRASTPSAAAEMAAKGREELIDTIYHFYTSLNHNAKSIILRYKSQLYELAQSYTIRHFHGRIEEFIQRLDELLIRHAQGFPRLINSYRLKFDAFKVSPQLLKKHLYQLNLRYETVSDSLKNKFECHIKTIENRLLYSIGKLDAISPLRVLSRGYSLILDEEKRLLSSYNQIKIGSRVKSILSEGSFDSIIESLSHDNPLKK